MPVTMLPETHAAPAPSLRWTWIVYADNAKLGAITEVCQDEGISMRVRPSGYGDRPHRVKLSFRYGDVATAVQTLNRLESNLRRYQIT